MKITGTVQAFLELATHAPVLLRAPIMYQMRPGSKILVKSILVSLTWEWAFPASEDKATVAWIRTLTNSAIEVIDWTALP